MKNNKNLSIVDNGFMLIGKIVVVAGGVCGFFYLLNLIVRFLNPIVNKISNFCLTHIQLICIVFFALMCIVWFVANKYNAYKLRRKVTEVQ